MLYEQNTFYFCSDWDISDFAHSPTRDLVRDELLERLFGYIVRPYGRMSLIRSVILRLGPVWPSNPSREALGQTWAGFLEINDSPWSRKGFPALERLTLDLSDWLPGPGETEALNVQPLVQKFRRSEGLQELTVKGINDQSNLSDLKKGLVRSGGRFRVVACNDREICSEIV